ncbi:hypothetical protein DFP91_0400 [Pseudorhodoplanes sinuspersici]|nr:hypothetical protein DFP91_0400 [Pseudorhodoplanes sinuspersici]
MCRRCMVDTPWSNLRDVEANPLLIKIDVRSFSCMIMIAIYSSYSFYMSADCEPHTQTK